MTLELDQAVRHGYQVVLAAILQEGGLCLLFVLAPLNTPLDLLVVFEEFRYRFLAYAFFVVKALDPLGLFMHRAQDFYLVHST